VPAAELSFGMLRRRVEQVEAAGKLLIAADRAAALFHAAALGTVVTLLRSQPQERDLTLSSMTRDNTLSMIADTEPIPRKKSTLSAAASAVYAAVKIEDGFSVSELALLKEWMKRIAKK